MKKILFLPFLQIPSGHHQAANALMTHIQRINPSLQCEKVDLFSYSYGIVEKWSSRLYLKWIQSLPKMYSTLYKQIVFSDLQKEKDRFFYERFFQRPITQLIDQKQPSLIVCTHALPSLLLSKMKKAGIIDIPVFNVYTDFFIHKGWGIAGIDGHFVSTDKMKTYLLGKGVKEESIFFTGIPTHPELKEKPIIPEKPVFKGNILLSGGSMGAGNIGDVLKRIKGKERLHYYVLCGKNKQLYRQILRLDKENITPIGYIPSRRMMNCIYEQMDLLLTKPGGVTVTEAMKKKIPTFIFHTLPGQEEINLSELKRLRLVEDYSQPTKQESLPEQLQEFLHSPTKLSEYFNGLYEYEKGKLPLSPAEIVMDTIN